jgi:putative tryptophan/tyrosine transport system substrate-binding protein
MRRREFIALVGGAAAAWPIAARAQQQGKLPTIGLLGPTLPSNDNPRITAFVQRLRELGWVEGRTVTIEYRYAEGRRERFAEIASEFVRLRVDLIVTAGTPAVLAAKQATSAIPIVFMSAANPVGNGLVASLAQPGGNVTGLSHQVTDVSGKRIELFREIVPGLRRLAILGSLNSPAAMLEMGEAEAAAGKLRLTVARLEIQRPEDIEAAVEAAKAKADGLYVAADPLVLTNRVRVNTLALGARLPTTYPYREYVEVGGLMSYGTNRADLGRRAGDLVDKILRGTKVAEIPVEQPTRFDFVINLTTAKALGLTVPESLLLRANEVIE